MIQDPTDELVDAVRRSGDDPRPSDRAAVALVRRRFGLSLPLPFAELPKPDEDIPVRKAVGVDGPAIAATKWRSWKVTYRGIVPDDFLDRLAVLPQPGFWTGLATLPPTRRHGLFVAGRPGTVLGLAAVSPWRPDEGDPIAPGLDPETTAQMNVLYLDPLVQRQGLGRRLTEVVVDHARAEGADALVLWVAEENHPARVFYEAMGWEADGTRASFDLEPGVAMPEVRYRFTRRSSP